MFEHSNELINALRVHLEEANASLNHIVHRAMEHCHEEDEDDEDRFRAIQLTLQYRLSSEDALSLLLKMDHNLLYFLGIQSAHSKKMNLDRLAYTVGNEDLKQILNVLAILTGSLSKIVAQYKNNYNSLALHQSKQKHQFISKELSLLLGQQKQYVEILLKLELEIEHLIKFPAEGPVLDHINALRGPISQFHQAVLHGLELSKQLYQHMNKKPLINYQLQALLKETNHLLHQMPNTYALTHQQTNSQQLEQRATAKRLRPFFD